MHRADCRTRGGGRADAEAISAASWLRGSLSTAGNLAFPFTPPEVSLGPAYRFNVYHLLRAQDPDALFPLEVEAL